MAERMTATRRAEIERFHGTDIPRARERELLAELAAVEAERDALRDALLKTALCCALNCTESPTETVAGRDYCRDHAGVARLKASEAMERERGRPGYDWPITDPADLFRR